MKEIWCEQFDELLDDFMEANGRNPNDDEELILSKKADEKTADYLANIIDANR